MMKYVGIPYKDKGRDFKGCDCYGLVKLFYINEFDIELADTEIQADQPKRIMINFVNEVAKNWEKTDTLKKGVVVAMSLHPESPKLVTHFGVMIDDKRVLHCIGKRNSHISPIDSIEIQPFVKGYYRWQH